MSAAATPRFADSEGVSRFFAALLAADWAEDPAELIGLEHEFVVRRRTETIDFRRLIGELPIDGQRLDPGDVNAHRCRFGGVITADGAEAEIATPPIEQKPGFVASLDEHARTAARALGTALPRGYALEGYSTHLSVAVPSLLGPTAAEEFVARFAPGLMLLTDRADSPGLLIRPRSGRLEAAFEFVSGTQLRAAAAYFAGAVRAVVSHLQGETPATLAPELRSAAVATADRVGWGLRRTAFGPDLLAAGRSASLTTMDGGTISAQEHLAQAWVSARTALRGVAGPSDLRAATQLVGGKGLLPHESSEQSAPRIIISRRNSPEGIQVSPFGSLLDERRRDAVTVAARLATWDLTIFDVVGHGRTAYAAVPRAFLARFLDLLDRGALDETLTEFVARAAVGHRLEGWAHAQSPGLYDELGAATSFITPEATYEPSITATDTANRDRVGKPVVPLMGEPPATTGGRSWTLIALLISLLLLVTGTGFTIGLVYGLGGGVPVPSATPVAVLVTPSPTPAVVVTPLPTASPTPALVATPSPTPAVIVTPSPTPASVITPTPPPNILEAVCIRVVHQALGTFISYLDLVMYWSGAEVDYFDVVVIGANDDEPLRLAIDPESGAWIGQFGLRGTGEKEILSLTAHLTDGSTVDLTDALRDALGEPALTVRFPQEDTFGVCP